MSKKNTAAAPIAGPSETESTFDAYFTAISDLVSTSEARHAKEPESKRLDLKKMRLKIVTLAVKHYKGDYLKTIAKIIILFILRGNNLTKIIPSLPDSVRTLTENYKRDFAIVDKPNKNMEAILLSRFAMCFPELALRITSRMSDLKDIVPDAPEGFPPCMMNGSFAALIPTAPVAGKISEADIVTIYHAFCAHEAKRSVILSGNKKTLNHCLDDARRYIRIGREQSLTPNSMRHDLLMEPDTLIFTSNNQINPALVTMAATYARALH